LKKNFKVLELEENTRIDRWLRRKFSSLNQSFIEKNLRKGFIKVNNNKIKANYKLLKEDTVNIIHYSKEVFYYIEKKNFTKVSKLMKEKFVQNIIYEDQDFIVVNKWNGIATQRGSKIILSINDIIKNFSKNYNLVHRLDKDTSGLLIISKNLKNTKLFAHLFKEQKIYKLYLAVCQGRPKYKESVVNLQIKNKKKTEKLSTSITKYKLIQTKNNLSLIIFKPLTGRTHQLRIVAKHLGCPIIGDKKYNYDLRDNFESLKLNAYYLKFSINDKSYNFKSVLPDHFKNFLIKNKFQNYVDKYLNYFIK